MKKPRKEHPATLSISPKLLARIRVYVSARGMKIYAWAEKALATAMDKGEYSGEKINNKRVYFKSQIYT